MNYSYANHYIDSCNKNNIHIDKNFVAWMNKVEKLVIDKISTDLLDLPDNEYMCNFENKMKEQVMTQIVINDFEHCYDHLF
jgi:hypothetical protein